MSVSKRDGVALYLSIQNDIRKDIAEGRLRANDRIMSESELVNRYQVSRVTASKALNELAESGWIYRVQGNGSFVSENIEEILRSPEHLDSYNISRRTVENGGDESRGSRRKRKRLMGLVLPTMLDDYALKLVDGINHAVEERGYSLMICLTYGDKKTEKDSISQLMDAGVEGILIFPTDSPIYNEEILEMKINHFPFVLLDRTLPGVITNYAMCDNVAGAQLAVQHLYEQGHRRIAFCSDGNMHVRTVADRFTGYKKQMREYDLSYLTFNRYIDFNYQDFSSNDKLLDVIRNKRVTAFFVAESYVCMYLYAMITSEGYRVPEDFSLVTFDNPMPSWEGMEFFTYINQNSYITGREAVRILCDTIESPVDNDAYRSKVIMPELCIRKSTGPPQTIELEAAFSRG